MRGSEVARWTEAADAEAIVEDGDPRALWTVDELDDVVPAQLLTTAGSAR